MTHLLVDVEIKSVYKVKEREKVHNTEREKVGDIKREREWEIEKERETETERARWLWLSW